MILLDAMKNYLHHLEPFAVFPMTQPNFAIDGPSFDDYRWHMDIPDENESKQLYDQAIHSRHERGRYHSWELVSEQVLLKDCDLSFWKYKGATIPYDLFWFFGAEDMERSTRREIILTYHGHDYKAHLERERHKLGRVRIFWSTELQKNSPLWDRAQKNSPPVSIVRMMRIISSVFFILKQSPLIRMNFKIPQKNSPTANPSAKAARPTSIRQNTNAALKTDSPP